MKFSEKAQLSLKDMGINPNEYANDLFSRYRTSANLIDKLICSFSDLPKSELTRCAFNEFIISSGLSCQYLLHDQSYDIFNYLRMFKDGGKFGLFKGRQAEWGGPVVTLQKDDTPTSDIDHLTDGSEIYRGMASSELQSSEFGQSWTTDIEVARKFAFETYSDKPRGIVAKAILEKENAIYYSLHDSESEVIILSGSITAAEGIET